MTTAAVRGQYRQIISGTVGLGKSEEECINIVSDLTSAYTSVEYIAFDVLIYSLHSLLLASAVDFLQLL